MDIDLFVNDLLSSAISRKAHTIRVLVTDHGGSCVHLGLMDSMIKAHSLEREAADRVCERLFFLLSAGSGRVFDRYQAQSFVLRSGMLNPAVALISVAVAPLTSGYLMHIGIQYTAQQHRSLKDLGFSKENIQAIEYMAMRPSGIMIVAGKHRSCKRDTLLAVTTGILSRQRYSMIAITRGINFDNDNIVNIGFENDEAPIGTALQLDPDVMLLSGVDLALAGKPVVMAAMSGVRVWMTMRATSALSALDRLCALAHQEIGDPTVVGGVIYQRALPKLCPSCRIPMRERIDRLDRDSVRNLAKAVDLDAAYVTGNGCDHCHGQGVDGVIVVAETLVTDERMMTLYRNGDRVAMIDYVRHEQAQASIIEDAIRKINTGFLDPLRTERIVGALYSEAIERDHRITREELL